MYMFILFGQYIFWYHPIVFVIIGVISLMIYDIFLLFQIRNLHHTLENPPVLNNQQQTRYYARHPRPANAQQQNRPANAEQQNRPANAEQQNRPANAQQQNRPANVQQPRPANTQPIRNTPQQGGNAHDNNTTTVPVAQPTLPVFPLDEQIRTNAVNDARGQVHNRLFDAIGSRLRADRNRRLNANPQQLDFGLRPYDNTPYANLHEYTFPPREDPAGQQATENINAYYQEQNEMFPFKFNNQRIQTAIERIATFVQLSNLPMFICLRSPLAKHQAELAMSKSIINELFSVERENRLLSILDYLSDPAILAENADYLADSIATLTVFAWGLSLTPQPESPFLQVHKLLRDGFKCKNGRYICDYILTCLNDPSVTSTIMNHVLPMEEARLNDQDTLSATVLTTITNAPFMVPLVQTPEHHSRFAMPNTRLNAQKSTRETPETETFKADVDLQIHEMNRIMTDFFKDIGPTVTREPEANEPNYVPSSPGRPRSDDDDLSPPHDIMFSSPVQANNPNVVLQTADHGTQIAQENINRDAQNPPSQAATTRDTQNPPPQAATTRDTQTTGTANVNPPANLPTVPETAPQERLTFPSHLIDFTQNFQHPNFARPRNAPANVSGNTSNQGGRNPAASSNTRQTTLNRTPREDNQAGPSNTQGNNQTTGPSNTRGNSRTAVLSNTDGNNQREPLNTTQATVPNVTSQQVNLPENPPTTTITGGPPSEYFRRRRTPVLEGSNIPAAANISRTPANTNRRNRAPGPRGLPFQPFISPAIYRSPQQSQTGQTLNQPQAAQPQATQPQTAQPSTTRDVNITVAHFSRVPAQLINIIDDNDIPTDGDEVQPTTNQANTRFSELNNFPRSGLINSDTWTFSDISPSSFVPPRFTDDSENSEHDGNDIIQDPFRWIAEVSSSNLFTRSEPSSSFGEEESISSFRSLPAFTSRRYPVTFDAPPNTAGSSLNSNPRDAVPTQEETDSSYHSLVLREASGETGSSNNSRNQATEPPARLSTSVLKSQEDVLPYIITSSFDFTLLKGTNSSDVFMSYEGNNTRDMSMHVELPNVEPQYMAPLGENLIAESQNTIPVVTTENPVLRSRDVPPTAVIYPSSIPQNIPILVPEHPVVEPQQDTRPAVLEPQQDIPAHAPANQPQQNIPAPANEPQAISTNAEAPVDEHQEEFSILRFDYEDYFPLDQIFQDIAKAHYSEVLRVRAVYRNFMAQTDDFFKSNTIDSFNVIYALASTGNTTLEVLKQLEDIQNAYAIFSHHIKTIETFVHQFETYFVVYQNINVLTAYYLKAQSLVNALQTNHQGFLTKGNILKTRSVVQTMVQMTYALETVHRLYEMNNIALHPNNVIQNLVGDLNKMTGYCYNLANAFRTGFEHAWCIPFNPLPHMLTLPNRLELNQEDGSNRYRTRLGANFYHADPV